ncbi:hypothetical protein GTR02_03050 [Kineococcus sp. R8]|uniref:RNA-directed DNA polymerase n=1 Tax=Kineococcus siccus TaxID=2696567 RepID=UPI001412CB1F|nr:RNA-directed DNA polymerase [Kineococcus siccus]NAZ80797.1 hypothetical protein [Kineococcus siccus]
MAELERISASEAFRSATTQRNLREIYHHHVADSRARGRDGLAGEHLLSGLHPLCRQLSFSLRSGMQEFTQYRELLASKGAGKAPRVLSIPTARDRIALKALSQTLIRVFPEASGVIPQVRVREVSTALSEGMFDSFVRLDVKNFYPSIPLSEIQRALTTRIHTASLIDVLSRAVSTPTVADRSPRRELANLVGIPQGLSISNVLAEIVVNPIDSYFKSRTDLHYFRFVDDVLILCDRNLASELAEEARSRFATIGLETHPVNELGSKSTVGAVSDGFDYLGYLFGGGHTSVRKSSIYNVESTLARAFTRYKKDLAESNGALQREQILNRCLWTVNVTVSGCIYKRSARGWMHYFRQMDDLVLVKRLDATLRRFHKRFRMPNTFEPKTFMRTYWAIRNPKNSPAGYVPDFDAYSTDRMRKHLSEVLGENDAYEIEPIEVERRFKTHIDRMVTELERDVASVS